MPNDFDLVPVDHDPFDPTGLIGPTQRLGEPSVLDYAGGFLRGGLYGAAKVGGAQTPAWMDKAANVLQNPDLNTAMGMAMPTPPNFAANLKMLMESTDLSQTEIAKRLGVGTATVRRNIDKLGLTHRLGPEETGVWAKPENVETLLRMHAEGASDHEIAKALGVRPTSISGRRYRTGLDRNFDPGQRENPAKTRRWGGTAEGFPIPMSGKKPTLPNVSIEDPGVAGDPWLMQQLGYEADFIPVDHDPFKK